MIKFNIFERRFECLKISINCRYGILDNFNIDIERLLFWDMFFLYIVCILCSCGWNREDVLIWYLVYEKVFSYSIYIILIGIFVSYVCLLIVLDMEFYMVSLYF